MTISCSKEELPPKVYEVPALIQPYIDDFIAEAAKRGQNLVIDDLKVEFSTNLQNGDAAGLCTFANENNAAKIQLDTTSSNWQNNASSREALIFHELGHCILNRPHRDDILSNGNFASMMRAKGEQVFGGSLNNFKRDYYLDELFDENTPEPDWAKNIPAYNSISSAQKTQIYQETFDSDADADLRWSRGTSNKSIRKIENGYYYFESIDDGAYFSPIGIPINQNTDFEIETAIKIVSGDRSTMLQWGGSSAENLFFYGFTSGKFSFMGNWQSGTSAARDVNNLQPNTYTKLTIRKISDNYYFYINEELFDNGKFEAFFGNLIGFYVGPQTAIQADYLSIHRIN